MKKLILAILMMSASLVAHSQSVVGPVGNGGTFPFPAAYVGGLSDALNLAPASNAYSIEWVPTGGTATACTLTVEGSIEGNFWFPVDGGTPSNCLGTPGLISIVGHPTRLVRVRFVTYSDPARRGVNLYYSGSSN